jgi:hypothetical protein
MIKRLLSETSKLIVIASVSLFSLFIYANIYEYTAFTDLKLTDTVQITKAPDLIALSDEEKSNTFEKITSSPSISKSTNNSTIINNIENVRESSTSDNAHVTESIDFGFFGQPSTFRYPKLNFVANIRESDKARDGWLIYKNALASHTFSNANAGVIGNTIIFSSDHNHIMDFLTLSNEGDRLVLETKSGWKYNYKIVNKIVISNKDKYLPSETTIGRLYLIDSLSDSKYLLIECDYSSIESA